MKPLSPAQARALAFVGVAVALVFGADLLFRIGDPEGARGPAPAARDVLAWWVHGARRTVTTVGFATAVAFVFGLWGGCAAAIGPRLLRGLLARCVEAAGAAPTVVLAAIVLELSPEHRPIAFVMLIAAVSAIGVARVVSTHARRVLSEEFILAARGLGAGPLHLFRDHLLRHVAERAAASALLAGPLAVSIEAALVHLGLLQPFATSWTLPLARPEAASPGVLVVAVASLVALTAGTYAAARLVGGHPPEGTARAVGIRTPRG